MPNDATSQSCSDLAVPVGERDHVKGPRTAPVVLVEYGDYECPYCLNAWPVMQSLQKQFGDRLAFVFRHFPQSSVHPHASVAAQAAEAAAAQDKFWEMHDLLFANQKDLGSVDLTHLALRIGLEVYRFQSSIETEGSSRKVREDFAGGVRSGVQGTPSFFINGCRYKGRVDVESFSAALRAAGV